ncbi:FtsK/SpoIIIE domain-containing protein [Aliarcobacter cryaerophilus]|uniref:FtsK/SpoIIIE domain-containing protein n=1 Tax=Aliarcobacter cryaerophilus TaxID=28198 RepID=UPI0021B1616F|nr:FtsK/SpoIIIE domain-containing protein [Aliarcobacter cryaerophilus]MCT7483784.1 FtsK/SpoIIIE domain-containing protein [Aliarcobacter cryaerophilus]
MNHGIKLLALSLIKAWGLFAMGLFLIFYIKNKAVNVALDSLISPSVIFAISVITFVIIYYYIKNWKYITMPYSLKLITQPKDENKETAVFVDKFIFYNKFTNTLYFRNKNAIDLKLYQDKKNEIMHFLGLQTKSIEMEIKPLFRKWVKIELYELPNSFNFEIRKLKKGYLYYGVSSKGDYYQSIENQTTMIVVGESGSGKSNLLNLLIYSIYINYGNGSYEDSNISSTILIDLKGNELSLYKYKGTQFIDNIQDVATVFTELKEVMYNRYKEMQINGDKLYKGKPIYVVIDEVGTIGTYHDKKIRDAIFNDMIELFQKGRACKIIFLIFAQKCDSTNIPSNVLTNIQSRILMKTDSEFNTNSMIGTKEQIQVITHIDVANFNKGRAIIKDGISSQTTLIQVPYVSENEHRNIVRHLGHSLKN